MELATRTFTELEAIIERGLTTFVDVGTALMEIRDGLLYRQTHPEFDDYCRERWGMSRFYAHRLIAASEVVHSLPIGNTPAPVRETQVRELAKAEPEQRAETWQAVIEEHGVNATAQDVRSVVEAKRFDYAPRNDWKKPTPLKAIPDYIAALPEEDAVAIADDFYRAQLPSMVDQVVSLACGYVRKASVSAIRELARINWDDVTDEMREDDSITDSLYQMDKELRLWADAMKHVRPSGSQLRRVK